MILSTFTPGELCQAISSNNERMLTNVKGIGTRSAQRIIVELKDKIPFVEDSTILPVQKIMQGERPFHLEKRTGAVQALTDVGLLSCPEQKAVSEILEKNPDLATEEVIKRR